MTIVDRTAPTDHDILDVLQARWSPRAYEPVAVDEDLLAKAIEAARWSPSAYNAQPWRFVVALGVGVGQAIEAPIGPRASLLFGSLGSVGFVGLVEEQLVVVFVESLAGLDFLGRFLVFGLVLVVFFVLVLDHILVVGLQILVGLLVVEFVSRPFEDLDLVVGNVCEDLDLVSRALSISACIRTLRLKLSISSSETVSALATTGIKLTLV